MCVPENIPSVMMKGVLGVWITGVAHCECLRVLQAQRRLCRARQAPCDHAMLVEGGHSAPFRTDLQGGGSTLVSCGVQCMSVRDVMVLSGSAQTACSSACPRVSDEGQEAPRKRFITAGQPLPLAT